jgi:tRNA (cytidine/uridine-2'-O-)-methyltransferase
MSLVLFEPDIPQNTGGMIRLAACMGVPLHIIEPCGFAFDEKKLKRVAMDYWEHARIMRHISWQKFLDYNQAQPGRLVLLSTHASLPYIEFEFKKTDMLILGRESSGVPDYVRDAAAARVTIPMHNGTRSLNVAMAAGIVLGEMIRQTA